MIFHAVARKLKRKLFKEPPVVRPTVMSLRCREITPADLDGVIDLLMKGFGTSRSHWERVISLLTNHNTPENFPKYGFMLENGDTPVGVLLLIFTTRLINGNSQVWCNESSYYVDPAFRVYATILVRRAHRHKEVIYLNLTPTFHSWKVLDAQGYKRLTKGVYAALPALCRTQRNVQLHVVTATYRDERLDPPENDLLATHAGYGCLSVICEYQGTLHPFVFAPCRRHGLPMAHLVYRREQSDFTMFAGTLGRFLLRHGYPVVLLDSDHRMAIPGKQIGSMPKYWLGPERPRTGDLAYTEIPMFQVI